MKLSDIPSYAIDHGPNGGTIAEQLTEQGVEFDPEFISVLDEGQQVMNRMYQMRILNRKAMSRAYNRIFDAISTHVVAIYVTKKS